VSTAGADTRLQLLNLNDAARSCNVSPHTVRKWVREQKLRPVRICRRLLFDPAELARFLAEGMRPRIETMEGR